MNEVTTSASYQISLISDGFQKYYGAHTTKCQTMRLTSFSSNLMLYHDYKHTRRNADINYKRTSALIALLLKIIEI